MTLKIKKALYIIFLCLCFGLLITNVYPLDVNNIKAYPVPFNPNKHDSLKIDGFPADTNKIKMVIMDINGDSVFTREYSSSATIIWNGRNGNGRTAKPGLYIIKLTVETSSGDYGKKIIRILING
ncbi:MAG: hypothetical protein V1874_11650 [Spirochaetota bacterium]